MQLKDIMTKPLDTVSASATLQEAAQHMRKNDVGALPVVVDDKASGLITDRDIVLRAVAEGKNTKEARVNEVMTPDAICHDENDDVERVLESMQKHKVRRVVVIDQAKRPQGILSLGDLATRTDSMKKTHEVLQSLSGAAKVTR